MNIEVDFATSNRIIFGAGELEKLAELIRGFGDRAFVVLSPNVTAIDNLFQILEKADIGWSDFTVTHEPDVESVNKASELARSEKSDFVIGFGGGSVLDTGKAVSALLTNSGDLMDYLEVVGKGLPLKNFAKPYIATPTTAGTGSEVTSNAVIAVPQKKVKVSMRSPFLLPEISLVDPEITYSVPPETTALTGMDAFTQVIEPFVSNQSNAMVDMFCRDAIPRAANNLYRAYIDGSDKEARMNMAWVSLMGGLSLANAKLGAVHGFAGPIGGMFHAPHGAVCAALLAAVMRINVEEIQKRGDHQAVQDRYEQIARWITGDLDATINDGTAWIDQLCQKLNIPKLSKMGISAKDFPSIVDKAENSSSMKGNPVKLGREELIRILELSY